ncbi:MAG: hypothetical protein JW915_06290 [Chitinispirillaceae bacterium]|nr:hypothetical protein [Chitinispirillaceae bacterium]
MCSLFSKKFILFLMLSVQLFSQESVEIDRYGKRIQLDGFLVEWSEKYSKKWDSAGVWLWDVINTPEGISGYFKSTRALPCSSWNFLIESSGNGKPFIITIPSADEPHQQFYRFDHELFKESSRLAVEWVIPWNAADLDNKGRYALDTRARDGCGDTLSSIMITGSKEPPQRIITGKIIIQAVAIVVLLVLYIVFRIKIMHQKRRKR